MPTLNPWFAAVIVLLADVVLVIIRAPHGQRSRSVPVARNRKGRQETILLIIAWIAFIFPLVWIMSPWLEFADYPLHLIPFFAGIMCYIFGLWLFHRSHVDLGTNWSITLEVREQHRLITHGVYRWVRHPMYLALFLFGAGQALVLPNWIVGPSDLAAMAILFAFRLGPEERMMREEFGTEYEAYMASTKRLIPGVW